MADTGAIYIGRLKVRTFSNGDVLIAQPRMNFAWCFLLMIVSLSTGIASLFVAKQIQYGFSLASVISFISAGLLFRAWLRPGSVYISRQRKHLRVKTKEKKSLIEADELQSIQFIWTGESGELNANVKDASTCLLMQLPGKGRTETEVRRDATVITNILSEALEAQLEIK